MDDSAGEAGRGERLMRESLFQAKPRTSDLVGAIDLADRQDQVARIALDEVPAIGLELVMDLVDQALGAIEIDRLLAPDQYPEEVIEADEMIDMSVGDEHVLEAMDLSGRQDRDVPEIKEEGAAFEQRLDIERRI